MTDHFHAKCMKVSEGAKIRNRSPVYQCSGLSCKLLNPIV